MANEPATSTTTWAQAETADGARRMAPVIRRTPPSESEVWSHPPPRLTMGDALGRGRDLMNAAARTHGFGVVREAYVSHDVGRRAYRYVVQSTLDVSARHPSTQLWLSDRDGGLLALERPSGQDQGTTLTAWLFSLHFGAVDALGGVFAWGWRVMVVLIGVAIAGLSMSGVALWWRGRRRCQRR